MRDQFNARLSEPDIPKLVITPLLKTKISFNLFDMIDRDERGGAQIYSEILTSPQKIFCYIFLNRFLKNLIDRHNEKKTT